MYKVLFIGGSGRSGSTLLDLALGRRSSAVSLGEVRHVWQRGLIENRPCGCGTPFRTCPFWQEVFQQAFGGICAVDAKRVRQLQRRIDRIRYIPALATRSGPSSLARRREEYGEYLRTLYSAISRVTGASLLVDSTKDPSHGYVVTGSEPRSYCLHLVRDPRGVSHSRRRRKFDPATREEMDRHGLVKSATDWLLNNALVLLLSRLDVPYMRIRYEEFARSPAATVDRVLRFVDEPGEPDPALARGELRADGNHTVSGNPLRYRRDPMPIEPDLEWREAMERRSRIATAAITWPLLTTFGFELRASDPGP